MQSAGRGRMGRAWAGGQGNVLATCVLRRVDDLALRQALPFIAGCAVYLAIAPLLPPFQKSQLHLKWPNDVLYNDAKLAGILIEVHSTATNAGDVVLIGFGVNNATAPYIESRATTCLADLGVIMSAADVCERLRAAFEEYWRAYTHSRNFEQLLNDWQACALPLGAEMRVNGHESQLIGAYHGLDVDGAMLLQLPDGTIERITAADVHLLHAVQE